MAKTAGKAESSSIQEKKKAPWNLGKPGCGPGLGGKKNVHRGGVVDGPKSGEGGRLGKKLV